MATNLDLQDIDLGQLDSFLMSESAPEDCMQLSDLDGFLTAVAIGPDLIMPSEWLPIIWGGEEPVFADQEEAQRVVGAIMGRYNEILQLLRHEPYAYEPLIWETPNGKRIADDWAEGFMTGVALRQNAWRPLLESDEDSLLLEPIAFLFDDEEGDPGTDEQLADMRSMATDLIASAVPAIDAYWKRCRRSRSHARASKPRPGRNDLCPCGSGRKYKRCCGAN
jgi:uncharacterized protein